MLADRFELQDVLGSGGMATVWSAVDRQLGRTVAVKVLRSGMSEEHAHRIEREARAAARIDDPRVVTVLDLQRTEDGTPFLVLEALEGRNLADVLRDGPLPVARVERLAADLLGGLGAAHECGVLHRDVKPSNILVVDDGFRITDFGIASVDDETATNGDLMGTLVYLAPERFQGAPASPRSDVFAAAAVLYEALTGHQPFRGLSPSDSLARIRSGQMDPLPAELPDRLTIPIRRALDPEPSRRPADAGEFDRMLRAGADEPTEPIDLSDATVRLEPPHGLGRGDALGRRGSLDRTAAVDRTDVAPSAIPRPDPAGPPTSVAVHGPATHDRQSRHRSGLESVLARVKEPRFVFVGIAIVLLVLLLVAAASAGSGGSGAPTSTSPGDLAPKQAATQLDHNLDRIQDLGR